jgi:hypothetical protein
MSATYNWAYKSGSPVPVDYRAAIGAVTIAVSADNVKPSNAVYVALFGNDATGNGSRQLPFRTINKACQTGTQLIIIGSGVYREALTPISTPQLLGDGDVIIDGITIAVYLSWQKGIIPYNIKFRGFSYLSKNGDSNSDAQSVLVNCSFDGTAPGGEASLSFRGASNIFKKNVVAHTKIFFNGNTANDNIPLNKIVSNTFVATDVIFENNINNQRFGVNTCVFYGCNIWFGSVPNFLDHCLFYNCNFKFTNSVIGIPIWPIGLPSSAPVGYTNYTSIADLQTACLTTYGTAEVFQACKVADPKFNNVAIGDYTLAFDSPAKNLSYLGTFAGARSIAYPIKISTAENTGGFELSSAVNLTIADDSIKLTDASLDAQIDTNVIVNALGRELANFPSYGFNADRNGQYVDSFSNLDAVTKVAGDILKVPASYIVEAGSVVYNSLTFQPGERLTTIAGQTTFSTPVSGVLREILEAPQRHTIMARFSNGGDIINAGDTLVAGNYYYVTSGSVTYNGIIRSTGTVFKAVNTDAFTGAGTVIVAFSTENYQHYEPGVKPTSNNIGDSRIGSIIRGNGDPAYVRGGLGIQEFPISQRFIQVRYDIRVNNLKP